MLSTSLNLSVIIFIGIMCLEIALAIYVLIRDRIDIIRSIKPNSIASFFGLGSKNENLWDLRNMFLIIGLNLVLLFIWLPFWILDKTFKLNIFEENNPK